MMKGERKEITLAKGEGQQKRQTLGLEILRRILAEGKRFTQPAWYVSERGVRAIGGAERKNQTKTQCTHVGRLGSEMSSNRNKNNNGEKENREMGDYQHLSEVPPENEKGREWRGAQV